VLLVVRALAVPVPASMFGRLGVGETWCAELAGSGLATRSHELKKRKCLQEKVDGLCIGIASLGIGYQLRDELEWLLFPLRRTRVL
jgi:hypothetical protein